MKFSIIILSYNTKRESLLLTLKSVLLQDILDDIEIIMADDGSKEKYEKETVKMFEKYEFSNYVFAPNKENIGTVKNILRALQYATGEFV